MGADAQGKADRDVLLVAPWQGDRHPDHGWVRLVLGRPDASPARRQVGMLFVGAYLVLTVLVFAFFYPLYTAQVVPYQFWVNHVWFPSWT